MGTARLAAGARWFDVDPERLAQKAELLATRFDEVVGLLPGTEPAAAPVLDELEEMAVGIRQPFPRERVGGAGGEHPLVAAARLVSDDLCLLVPGPSGRLVLGAAVVCFPSHWRIADKLGHSVVDVHDTVPGYADELGAKVDAFLARLKPGAPVWRRNWSIHELPDLFSPFAPGRTIGVPPDEQWLRSEFETLHRLPAPSGAGSGGRPPGPGAVLFTIRVQQCRLADLASRPDIAARLASRLAAQPALLSAYQDLSDRLPALIDYLAGITHRVGRP